MKVQDKVRAIGLRMEGYSYKEIMAVVPVSKGTLSGWLHRVVLNSEQEHRLIENITERSKFGRVRAGETNRAKRAQKEKEVFSVAKTLFYIHKNDPLFILGISLYWAEGSKRTSSFQFMNSDPQMIVFMIYWVQKYLGIVKKDIFLRIHTHEDFRSENYELFWQTAAGIPAEQFKKTAYKPNRHGIFKKNPNYKGCARLEIKGGITLLRKMLSLQKVLNSELEMLYSAL